MRYINNLTLEFNFPPAIIWHNGSNQPNLNKHIHPKVELNHITYQLIYIYTSQPQTYNSVWSQHQVTRVFTIQLTDAIKPNEFRSISMAANRPITPLDTISMDTSMHVHHQHQPHDHSGMATKTTTPHLLISNNQTTSNNMINLTKVNFTTPKLSWESPSDTPYLDSIEMQ